MRASAAVHFRCSSIVTAVACAALFAVARTASAAEWQPSGLTPATKPLAEIVALAKSAVPRPERRHEHWTYVNGAHRIAVDVNVRDDDFRTMLQLDGLTYTAGRLDGARWRADGNGIAHSVLGDDQGDAADVAPQALFAIDWSAVTLAGQTRLPMLSYVVETHREGEKPAFLYVDAASGTIVREVLRDGRRVTTTSFDRFEPRAGRPRARHWRADNGNAALLIDATLDAVEDREIAAADVALPVRHVSPGAIPETSTELPAHFRGDVVSIDVGINGDPVRQLFLDTGTSSITLDPSVAPRDASTLEHAALERMTVGTLHYDVVSTLTVPFWGYGILGYDFFFGHVVEIGYVHRRVRVLSSADAAAVFSDPNTRIVPIDVGWGLPLAHASAGDVRSETFALDTGSPRMYLSAGLATRNAREIATWAPAGKPFIERYLEGSIHVQPYRVPRVAFAGITLADTIVGIQNPAAGDDDIKLYFDGIIGTEILGKFDLYFDYDHGRLGLVR